MRKMLFAVSFAAALGLVAVSDAGAVPADATAVRCFRAFVVGPYRCHWYPL